MDLTCFRLAGSFSTRNVCRRPRSRTSNFSKFVPSPLGMDSSTLNELLRLLVFFFRYVFRCGSSRSGGKVFFHGAQHQESLEECKRPLACRAEGRWPWCAVRALLSYLYKVVQRVLSARVCTELSTKLVAHGPRDPEHERSCETSLCNSSSQLTRLSSRTGELSHGG